VTSTYRSDPATEPVRIVGYSKPRTRTSDDVTDHRRQNVAAGRPRPDADSRVRYVDFLVARRDDRRG